MICVEGNFRTKICPKTSRFSDNFSGKLWGNSGKNLSHSQIFSCCYTYDPTIVVIELFMKNP